MGPVFSQTDLLDTVREERERNAALASKLAESETAVVALRGDLQGVRSTLGNREDRVRSLQSEVRVWQRGGVEVGRRCAWVATAQAAPELPFVRTRTV